MFSHELLCLAKVIPFIAMRRPPGRIHLIYCFDLFGFAVHWSSVWKFHFLECLQLFRFHKSAAKTHLRNL